MHMINYQAVISYKLGLETKKTSAMFNRLDDRFCRNKLLSFHLINYGTKRNYSSVDAEEVSGCLKSKARGNGTPGLLAL